jgi:hypothetical protein
LKDSRGEQIEIVFDYPEPDLTAQDIPEVPKRITTILTSHPFEATHQGIRNTTATMEFEELSILEEDGVTHR